MATRIKMSREERAKQFMPFAALKGYEEALRKKEKQLKEGDIVLINDKSQRDIYHDNTSTDDSFKSGIL